MHTCSSVEFFFAAAVTAFFFQSNYLHLLVVSSARPLGGESRLCRMAPIIPIGALFHPNNLFPYNRYIWLDIFFFSFHVCVFYVNTRRGGVRRG